MFLAAIPHESGTTELGSMSEGAALEKTSAQK